MVSLRNLLSFVASRRGKSDTLLAAGVIVRAPFDEVRTGFDFAVLPFVLSVAAKSNALERPRYSFFFSRSLRLAKGLCVAAVDSPRAVAPGFASASR